MPNDYEQFTERMTSFDLVLDPEGAPLQHYNYGSIEAMSLDAAAYMAHYGIEENELAHYGVKGMKWGVRKKSIPGAKSRAELRELDRASKRADRAKADTEIDNARARLEGGRKSQARADLTAAKLKYKVDRVTIGKREAKKVYNEAKDSYYDDVAKSQLTKSGKETYIAVAAVVGVTALRVLAASQAR